MRMINGVCVYVYLFREISGCHDTKRILCVCKYPKHIFPSQSGRPTHTQRVTSTRNRRKKVEVIATAKLCVRVCVWGR